MGMHVYRQGDVAFIPREDLPKSVADIDNMVGRDKKTKAKVLKTRVVRKGVNGGIHALDLEKAPDTVMYELDGVKYVLSPEGVDVVHGEHGKVELPKGSYEVRVQREADRAGWRNVMD